MEVIGMYFPVAITVDKQGDKDGYRIYDDLTGAVADLSYKYIRNMMYNNVNIANLEKLSSGAIILQGLPNELSLVNYTCLVCDNSNYVYLYKEINSEYYSLVNYNGCLIRATKSELLKYIKSGKILNYVMVHKNGRPQPKLYTHHNLESTQEFIESINKKFKAFQAKCNLMGINYTFKYSILGTDVIICRIFGSGDTIIVPSFVTTIGDYAFGMTDIEHVILNEGLKNIGNGAFSGTKINDITIPKSVEFIGPTAFHNTPLIIHFGRNYKQLNPYTVNADHLLARVAESGPFR